MRAARRARRERVVERRAIDDGGQDTIGVDHDRRAVVVSKGCRSRDGQDRLAGKVELVERLVAEDAGAVDRTSDVIMLLEDGDVMPGASEIGRSDETGGPGTHHDDVMHGLPAHRSTLASA
jgi:hypothetical protein